MRLSDELRKLANNKELLWNVPRKKIEDILVEMRESRISIIGRGNGLVIKESNGADSNMIRMTVEVAVATALNSIADDLDKNEN